MSDSEYYDEEETESEEEDDDELRDHVLLLHPKRAPIGWLHKWKKSFKGSKMMTMVKGGGSKASDWLLRSCRIT